MTRFSFQRLDDGTWGIKASGDLGQATKYVGQTVTVTKRDGSPQEVTLGGLVTSWNAGRAAVYTRGGAMRSRSWYVAPVTTEPDEVDREAEYDDWAAAEYFADLVTQVQAAMATGEVVGREQAAYYDYTTVRIKTDVPAAMVRMVLNRNSGRDMLAYGKFGGYTTCSGTTQVEPGVVDVLQCYHIGD